MIKVCHISRQDVSGEGGGYQAAYRIHEALRRAGCDSRMAVAFKASDDQYVMQVGAGEKKYQLELKGTETVHTTLKRLRRVCGIATPFHSDISFVSANSLLGLVRDAQILHLHWVSGTFASAQIQQLARVTRVPIVWTLMDIEPLTGGCHYAGGCSGYKQKCGCCPQLRSVLPCDLSRWGWSRKARHFRGLPITIVAPTSWVEDRVRESSLFHSCRIVRIPLAVDSEAFCPVDQGQARQMLGLPINKRLIFSGAPNFREERKGMRYLIEALHLLQGKLREKQFPGGDAVALVTAGAVDISKDVDVPFQVYHLGCLRGDTQLVAAYQAADVFVCPSIEDAGPMMINESLMCGTPVVAFNTGGAPDWIENLRTGYLAALRDSTDLAHGIYTLLTASDHLPAIRMNCREMAVRQFTPKVVVKRYMELYESLTESRKVLAK
jgi:glycosyltransferase involved in cell wall biosynthesis